MARRWAQSGSSKAPGTVATSIASSATPCRPNASSAPARSRSVSPWLKRASAIPMRSPSPFGSPWRCRGTVSLRSPRQPGQEVSELRLLGAQVLDVPGVGCDLERSTRLHPDAVALEPADLLGVVGEQADEPHTQVAQDLRTDAVVAQVLPEPELEVGLDRVAALVLERVGADLVGEADASSLLVQVDQHAAARRGDQIERLAELVATVASLGAEHVSGQAFRVQPHQHRRLALHVAEHE